MPSTRTYNPGSIVYFQDDMGDEIFVLQKGSLVLISNPVGQKGEVHEQVKVGEFFGVKSVLGHYPHEETAQAVEQATVVIFTIEEFEKYMISNTRLILKMMQLFSKELRDLHVRLRSVLKIGKEKNPAFELMVVGESFYRHHDLEHAKYVFNRYLETYPNGKNFLRAKDLLGFLQEGKTYPVNIGPLSAEEDNTKDAKGEAKSKNTLAEMQEKEKLSESKIIQLYQKGHAFFSSGDYINAISSLNECLKLIPTAKLEKEKEFAEIIEYELGVSFFRMKKNEEAIACFTKYIKTYPTGRYIRNCVYQMGLIQEMMGDKNQAKILYHKVATMQPYDAINAEARKSFLRVSSGEA